MYASLPKDLQVFMIKNPQSMYYNHNWGITEESFNKYLARDFVVTAWVLFGGKRLVSSMQHRKYPLYGFQNHFEKSQFFMKEKSHIPRLVNNYRLGFNIALFMSKMARKSMRTSVRGIRRYKRYNLFYRISERLSRKHYDPKSFVFRYRPRRIY